MGQFIDLTASDGNTFPAYVAEPAGEPRGAVVVLQEIFGVNSHIRSVADGYAAEGYLAVAPATFHRVQPGVELGYTGEDMTAGSAAAQFTRSEVNAQAATAAHGTNAYRQSAMSGVVPARASGIDRATVRNQVAATPRTSERDVRISSFGSRQLPAGDSATF